MTHNRTAADGEWESKEALGWVRYAIRLKRGQQ